jgi:lipoyl(octanoyl) transferase
MAPGTLQIPVDPAINTLHVRDLGLSDYETVWRAMQSFTDARDAGTPDEIWLLQHPPVFTLGQAGKAEHILAAGDIPVLRVDRGGQVTYHGPGQLVAYPLLDIRRLSMGIRELVNHIEEAVIRVLGHYGVEAGRAAGAPGVYVDGVKIAALGLRVRKGRSFHGLAFNIDMDLEPWQRINPCGFEGLAVTQLSAFGPVDIRTVQHELIESLARELGFGDRILQLDGALPPVQRIPGA